MTATDNPITPTTDITETLVSRIHEIGPLLLEGAVTADRDRRLPDATVEALRETGVREISTLQKYGGHEAGARTLFEVARTIGYYDPAAAWLTVISNGSVLLTNRWPEAAVNRVFDDGPVGMASVFASPRASIVRDGEGYRVSGKWPFASNIHHSDWAIGGAPVLESNGAAPTFGFALLSREQYSIEDTWYVVGLRGTGSNTLVVEDQWVPADQVISGRQLLGQELEADPHATFGLRLAPMTTMITTLTAPALGAAQAALDYVTEQAQQRGIAYSVYARQIDSRAFVKDLSHAALKLDTALLHLRRSADTVDAAAHNAQPLPVELRARSRGDVGTATHEIADAVNDLMWAHGTAAFAESALISRLWRDINTAVRHAMLAANINFEVYGGALLGVDYAMEMV
ncbi:hypothetical protein OHA40_07530 [Nocardia sp. NBC_00508]|uniref:hypothetical protein n=1 Tax=Nocardia sp. NBC_00508 TaxID=2975992 RepID=UPI002E820549|nr:hypothetical protein [Nocardia sp. NBC_00508]WUD67966.1 hypothetical protein OHA40_07530 [Nocardia sp. NBC_00508]